MRASIRGLLFALVAGFAVVVAPAEESPKVAEVVKRFGTPPSPGIT